jgi:putative membrane protein
MPSRVERLFPEGELDRILQAVREAESGTCGEIVPYVVTASDAYLETVWRATAIAGGVTLLILGILPLIGDGWFSMGVSWVAIIALGVALASGLAAALLPGLRRGMTPAGTIEHRVAQRAAEAFLSEEVFNTRDRVGILIFLSLMERRVVVLGDAGINARIDHAEWSGVRDIVVDGIRDGRPADGIIEGVRRCGALLVDRGFAIAADDVNELPDRLRME